MTNNDEILNHFDEIFETNVKEHLKDDMPMLKYLFDKFAEDMYTVTPQYKKISKGLVKASNDLHSILDKEQEKVLEEYLTVVNQLTSLENEKIFYFGYLIARELEIETKMSRN